MMLSYENRSTMGQPKPTTSNHIPLATSSSNTMPNGTSQRRIQPDTSHHHIWIVTGPAGCGKSTVAQFIAKTMNLPFIEGDEV
jgi:gluconokinase